MSLKKFIADSKMFEYDKYYRECQQNNRPFIKARINPSSGNYYVQMDLMTCKYDLSIEGKNKVMQLFETEISFLSSNKKKFDAYNVDKELCWFDGVLSSRLNAFCESLYDLSQSYHE